MKFEKEQVDLLNYPKHVQVDLLNYQKQEYNWSAQLLKQLQVDLLNYRKQRLFDLFKHQNSYKLICSTIESKRLERLTKLTEERRHLHQVLWETGQE